MAVKGGEGEGGTESELANARGKGGESAQTSEPACRFLSCPVSSHSNYVPAPALDRKTEEYKREEIRNTSAFSSLAPCFCPEQS